MTALRTVLGLWVLLCLPVGAWTLGGVVVRIRRHIRDRRVPLTDFAELRVLRGEVAELRARLQRARGLLEQMGGCGCPACNPLPPNETVVTLRPRPRGKGPSA